MKIRNPLRRAACLVALSACAATAASAADKGFYLGANLGKATYDVTESDLLNSNTPVTTSFTVKDDDSSYSMSFGYRFMRFVGVEVTLGDYGDLETKQTGFTTPARTVGFFSDTELGVRGASLAVIGSLPLQKFEIFGKVGAMHAETRLRVRQTAMFGATGGAGGKVEAETTAVLYGAGVGYTIGESFFVKLEYTLVPKVAEEEDEDLPIDVDLSEITFGFQYRF